MDLAKIREQLRQFVGERDWAQFHTPKNLATALSVEASELLELFQWLTDEQSKELPPDKRKAAAHEVADILIYVIRFADVMDIDISAAVEEKLAQNAEKYPIEKSKGRAVKYHEL